LPTRSKQEGRAGQVRRDPRPPSRRQATNPRCSWLPVVQRGAVRSASPVHAGAANVVPLNDGHLEALQHHMLGPSYNNGCSSAPPCAPAHRKLSPHTRARMRTPAHPPTITTTTHHAPHSLPPHLLYSVQRGSVASNASTNDNPAIPKTFSWLRKLPVCARFYMGSLRVGTDKGASKCLLLWACTTPAALAFNAMSLQEMHAVEGAVCAEHAVARAKGLTDTNAGHRSDCHMASGKLSGAGG
jgi:hypothetical protein